MLCVINNTAHDVSYHYDICEWLKLKKVSYYCSNSGSAFLPDVSGGLIISGGPFHSDSVRYLNSTISEFRGPILGICLGCMALVEVFGGTLGECEQADVISVEGEFPGFDNRSDAKAAHRQKIVSPGDLIPCLWDVKTREIVGVRHGTKQIFGVMFHPESPLTICGNDLLQQFLRLVR